MDYALPTRVALVLDGHDECCIVDKGFGVTFGWHVPHHQIFIVIKVTLDENLRARSRGR